MGYTKIKAVKNHLARCLDYTSNPVKTERFSEEDLSRLLDYTQNRDTQIRSGRWQETIS